MQEIGRVKQFERSVYDALAAANHGKKSSHEVRQYHLLKLIEDLRLINQLPNHIKNIKSKHIENLCRYWNSLGYSKRTIYEKVCFIRQAVLGSGGSLPSNKELGIKCDISNKPKFIISERGTDFIKSQIIKDICDVQLHFGLKKSEAMKISYYHDYYDRLFIDRKTAYNQRERYVDYQDVAQQAILFNITNRYKPAQLVSPNKRLSISQLHTQALKNQQINDEEYFRKLYMVNRYQVLIRSCISKRVNFQKIAEEVGLCDTGQIRLVVACLESN